MSISSAAPVGVVCSSATIICSLQAERHSGGSRHPQIAGCPETRGAAGCVPKHTISCLAQHSPLSANACLITLLSSAKLRPRSACRTLSSDSLSPITHIARHIPSDRQLKNRRIHGAIGVVNSGIGPASVKEPRRTYVGAPTDRASDRRAR